MSPVQQGAPSKLFVWKHLPALISFTFYLHFIYLNLIQTGKDFSRLHFIKHNLVKF